MPKSLIICILFWGLRKHFAKLNFLKKSLQNVKYTVCFKTQKLALCLLNEYFQNNMFSFFFN